MSHATEGELHAYLDGALSAIDAGAFERLQRHLGRCADCRALLEEERAIRERAGELLGVALPQVEAPAFEDVVGPVRSGPGRRLTPERLAWAAGIVVALGAGWMGSAMLRSDADMLPLGASPVAVSPGAPDALVAEPTFGEEAGLASEAERAGELPALFDERDEATTEARFFEDEAVNRPSAPAPLRQSVQQPTPEEEAIAGRVAGDAARDREGQVDDLAREGARQDAAAKSVDAADAPAVVGEVAGPPGSAALQERAVEPLTIGPGDRDLLVAGLAWRAGGEGEAEALLGRAPLRLPDVEIDGIEVAESGFVRVLQTLPGGEAVEIVQWRASDQVENPAAGEPAAERAERARETASAIARNMVGDVVVTVRAQLAPDSLRALASRVR